MAKYRLLRERLRRRGHRSTAADLRVPEAIAWDDLRLVHDAGVRRRGRRPARCRRGAAPHRLSVVAEMVERSRRSVGATLAAARDVAGRQPDAATTRRATASPAPRTSPAARITPSRDRGEGYCVFNDVAVAARVLQRDGAIARAAVVDCDVHQGNGTAAIFRDDPSVFTFSMHGAKNFPFRKETSDLDVTFDDGAGDDEYLAALARHLPGVLDGHRPDLVFYLAGADPYEGDRLGRLKLTDRRAAGARSPGLRRVPRARPAGRHHDERRLCPDVDAIVTIHANTIREARPRSCRSVFAC